MLNIPEEIKTLFKRDDIFKNFHVHFPNSEYTDLNNDDIVSESVEFTESLCSQQAFRFGLTEASEIKFTCVNVPNIRGAVIECAIEVQADSLGAEWLEDNQPTGNEEFLDPQVCTYSDRNMYRVPYGRFIVDTCPRNHETMYKRDVTGYTERMEDALVNPFQTGFMNSMFPITTYTFSDRALFYATLGNIDETMLTGFTETPVTMYVSQASETIAECTVTLTTGVSETVTFDLLRGYGTVTDLAETSLIKYVRNQKANEEGIRFLLIEVLEQMPIDLTAMGYSTAEELADYILSTISDFSFNMLKSYIEIGAAEQPVSTTVYIPETANILYPYFESYRTYNFRCPGGLRAQVGARTYTAEWGNEVYLLTDTSGEPYEEITVSNTLQTEYMYAEATTVYSFANAFSVSEMIRGYLELRCRFGSPARTGGMEITALDNTSPVSILPENYAELWYDETTIAPIGYVQVKFKDETDNEQDLTVQIGTGASVYDLRDNAVLQNMVFTVSKAEAEAGITIESKLLAFLNSVFTPNIPDLTFIPIELTKKGLPYLEAGDAVTITTGDGQVVPSFILRQTVKGIQFLTADVESANGEAVEMVET